MLTSQMKNTTFIVALLLSVFIMQSCKKSDVDTATSDNTTPAVFSAFINDTSWTPTTYNAGIAYTMATKNKVISWTATLGKQQVNLAITQKNAGNGNGFPTGIFTVDTTSRVVLSYALQNSANVFVPQGTVRPGSGSIAITAIDSVKMVITGTFSFNTIKYTYDSQGNITSLFVNNINSGSFNSMPYKYAKQ